jgi:hypothetical protein
MRTTSCSYKYLIHLFSPAPFVTPSLPATFRPVLARSESCVCLEVPEKPCCLLRPDTHICSTPKLPRTQRSRAINNTHVLGAPIGASRRSAFRNEPHLLLPASPKPMHFSASANVLVLAMQMDLGFNKTEAHMSDPAMHNADVQPDFWRHLAEQQQYNKRRLESR